MTLPPTFTEETKRFDAEFRKPLQAVLNEQFPKVHEEGEEKRRMKRGEALVLYGMAITLGRKLYDLGRADESEIVEKALQTSKQKWISQGRVETLKEVREWAEELLLSWPPLDEYVKVVKEGNKDDIYILGYEKAKSDLIARLTK